MPENSSHWILFDAEEGKEPVCGPEVCAVLEGDHYVLQGEKKWNTGGAVASYNTIFAVTEPGRQSNWRRNWLCSFHFLK